MSRNNEQKNKRKDRRTEARGIHHNAHDNTSHRNTWRGSYKKLIIKHDTEILKSNNDDNRSFPNAEFSIHEISDLWLASKRPYIKESTYTRYVCIIENHIKNAFQTKKLSAITPSNIKNFIIELKTADGRNSKHLSDKTIADIIYVFKGVWGYGKENGFSCCDFTFSVNKKSKKAKKPRVIPPETQRVIEKIITHSNNLTELGVSIAFFTGIRIGELCGLQWGDINFENGYISIKRTVERIADLNQSTSNKTKVIISEPKTVNSLRIIPLPDFLINTLQKQKKADEIYIITGKKTYTEPHTFYMRYKTFLRKNQLGDFTFHELRHTFATKCVDLGFEIKALSEILGHANINTTMNLYVHPTLEMKKRQMNLLKPCV